jgi:hypothetical protein
MAEVEPNVRRQQLALDDLKFTLSTLLQLPALLAGSSRRQDTIQRPDGIQ